MQQKNWRNWIKHDKYTTTQEFNKLTSENFATRLKEAKLSARDDIDDLIKKTNFDEKVTNINRNVTWKKTRNVEAGKK